jgi:hypothetical protein
MTIGIEKTVRRLRIPRLTTRGVVASGELPKGITLWAMEWNRTVDSSLDGARYSTLTA